MDELVREMHGTIEAYKEKALYAYKQAGMVCHVLEAQDEGFTLRTTFPRATFYQSPVQMEQEHGLTGISGGYKMPDGLSHLELQAYAEILRHAHVAGDITKDQMNDKFDQVLGMLTARNPQIAEIKPGSETLSRYNTVLGIASEYNPKDIQHFLDGESAGNMLGTDPAYDAAWGKVKDLTLTWIPAIDTLNEIARQMDAKPALSKFMRPDDVDAKPALPLLPAVISATPKAGNG